MHLETGKLHLISDEGLEYVKDLLGEVPNRWGRMNPLSRLLIIETARALYENAIISRGQRLSDQGVKAGLIGATRRGSLHTDQAFITTMAEGHGLASPALFGYTLPNIPLAEAAVAFGLTGPVYALFDTVTPFESAESEARLHLMLQQNLDFMIACEFDHYIGSDQHEELSVTLTVVK
jgi:hypothetical protein